MVEVQVQVVLICWQFLMRVVSGKDNETLGIEHAIVKINTKHRMVKTI